MRLLLNANDQVARYVDRLSLKRRRWSGHQAVGLVDAEGDLCAGAVFHGLEHPNIMVHLAIERPSPGFIAAVVHYVFVQLGCGRMTAFIAKDNEAAQRFARKLGGRVEGVLHRAAPDGGDVVVWGMLAEDAERWLTPPYMRKLKGLLHG